MRRPSPRRRIFCSTLLMVVVLTLLGHLCGVPSLDAASGADHDHHDGVPSVPDSAHVALCVAALSGGQSACPQLSEASSVVVATLPPALAMALVVTSRTASVPPARSGDDSPPLFLLHATFLI